MKVLRTLGKKALPVIASALVASATGCVADKGQATAVIQQKPRRVTTTAKQEARTAISSGPRLENRQTGRNPNSALTDPGF